MSTIKVTNDYRSKFANLMPMRNDDEHTFTPQCFLDIELDEGETAIYPTFTVRQFNNVQSLKFKKQVDKDNDAAMMDMRRMAMMQESIKDSTIIIPNKGSVVDKKSVIINLIKDVFVGWNDVWSSESEEDIEYEGDQSLYMLSEDILEYIIMEIAYISGSAKRPVQEEVVQEDEDTKD